MTKLTEPPGMAVTFDYGDPKAPWGDVHSRNKVTRCPDTVL